ncbi:UDP-N-acetylmuramoyl-L-alanine--D-glutamate ligase [Legionella londiniensis]|uniref:UDP-N-acetylmuramoylalanine--D-glutamate ligase n=1 Tax=Legionella londiniensis TaxID=45068 RepID=A0A0W0VRK2_9GAMM|nr:UDP-N-acetylmuramoyl-L-alanine--D-glutamate ligase [Legionella londiniensis]KTD22721.1 UDP-N-acetylmuramoylalanine--D-glutamate ligase [Legionella londiniensis]STX92450.1 UDP-N-acetylmuramoylalanine--D-glutamate ligase [Legionella londiniensis]
MNSPLYLVVGLGKTGYSIARYLQRRNKPFVVFDTRHDPENLQDFYTSFPGVDVFLSKFPTELYKHLQAIIVSPGVPLEEPFLQEARAMNIPVYGDIECLAKEISVPVVAITGTNGKSTVTTLVGEMAKASGLTVAVAGNIGLPALDILDVGAPYDLWVLELSSFQLDLTYSLSPAAAAILNVTPDHLDRHHSFQAYVQAKQRIYNQAEKIIYNLNDPTTFPQSEQSKRAHLISFSLEEPKDGQWGLRQRNNEIYLAKGKSLLLSTEALRIKGRHNWQNALAACALADAVGIDSKHMVDVLQRFPGLPHRSQWVRTLNGVDWVNDSKGTNVGATVSAISGIGGSMQGKIVLIAGGRGKGADFTELRQPMADYVRTVVLLGEDADKIQAAIGDTVHVLRAPSLAQAVKLAQAEAQPGDVVLLSPACASLDMFRDFNHRGDDFIAAVNAL